MLALMAYARIRHEQRNRLDISMDPGIKNELAGSCSKVTFMSFVLVSYLTPQALGGFPTELPAIGPGPLVSLLPIPLTSGATLTLHLSHIAEMLVLDIRIHSRLHDFADVYFLGILYF